jgi:hypothetical protein
MQEWLIRKSKYCCAAGVDKWDKCINVDGGDIRGINVFSRFEYRMFYILYPFVTYLLTLPHAFNCRA